MNGSEKWTRRLLWMIWGWTAFYAARYIAALAVAGFDLSPRVLPESTIFFLYYKSWMLWAWFGYAEPAGAKTADIVTNAIFTAQWLSCAVFFVLWLRTLWLERFPDGNRWFRRSLWLMLLPGIWYLFAAPMLAVLAWRRRTAVFALTLLCMVLAGVGHLGLLWCGYMLTTRATEMLFAVVDVVLLCYYSFIVIFIILAPCIAGVKWSRKLVYAFAIMGLLLAGAAVLPPLLLARANARTAEICEELRGIGNLADAADTKAFYFHGTEPDAEWTALVDGGMFGNSRRTALSDELHKCNGSLAALPHSPGAFESMRKLLADNAAFFSRIDSVFRPGAPAVKYALNPETSPNMYGVGLPQVWWLRNCTVFYGSRMRLAAYDRNPSAAMEMYLRADAVVRTALDEFGVIGSLVGIACSSITDNALADTLAARIFDDAQLAGIAALLETREAAVRKSMENGFRYESAYVASISPETLLNIDGRKIFEQLILTRARSKNVIYCIIANECNALLDIHKAIRSEIAAPGFDPARGIMLLNELEKSGTIGGEPARLFTERIATGLFGCWATVARETARLRMARIACEIERFRLKHNRIPASLDELRMADMPVNPFSKQQFGYETGRIAVRFPEANGNECVGTAVGYRLIADAPDNERYKVVFDVIEPATFVRSEDEPPEE